MFGMSAGTASLVGSIAGPVIGGLMGSGGNQQSSSSQQTIDPRMADAVYGSGGILPSAKDWYQNNSTGLNSQMTTGMDNQWNQLGASTQGFNQMQSLGMGLMGGGAAGNPFTGSGGVAPSKQTYNPAAFNTGSTSNPFAAMNAGYMEQAQAAEKKRLSDAEAARLAALQQQVMQPYSYGGSGNNSFGGGYGNGYGGGYGGPGDGMGSNSTDGGFGGGYGGDSGSYA